MPFMTGSEKTQFNQQLDQLLDADDNSIEADQLKDACKAVMSTAKGRLFLRAVLGAPFVTYKGSDPLLMARTHQHNATVNEAHQMLAELCPDEYLVYVKEHLISRERYDR